MGSLYATGDGRAYFTPDFSSALEYAEYNEKGIIAFWIPKSLYKEYQSKGYVNQDFAHGGKLEIGLPTFELGRLNSSTLGHYRHYFKQSLLKALF